MMDQPLAFLADESCDFSVVRALRSIGYNVSAIVEIMPGAPDSHILEVALTEKRILLTEDKDFGEWVFAHRKASPGVLLIRYPGNLRTQMTSAIIELVSEHGPELQGGYGVLEPGKIRIRRTT